MRAPIITELCFPGYGGSTYTCMPVITDQLALRSDQLRHKSKVRKSTSILIVGYPESANESQ